jgi:hypothetical protein
MGLFLTIFEGDTPADAHPILAIRDPTILAAVRQLLLDRLADDPSGKVLPLKRPRPAPKGPGAPAR